MHPEAFRRALRNRLGLTNAIPENTECPRCKQVMEPDCRHAIGCQGSRSTRHNAVRDALSAYAREAGRKTAIEQSLAMLSGYTGSPFFPGGSFEQVFTPGYLKFEQGPSAPLTLRWATYYDAADQAGLSRLYGGIHVAVDDFAGRRIGSRVGKSAWALAQRYFDGSARP